MRVTANELVEYIGTLATYSMIVGRHEEAVYDSRDGARRYRVRRTNTKYVYDVREEIEHERDVEM